MRQDVAEQDAAVPGAERPLGLDEVALGQRRASRCRSTRAICTQFTSAITSATIHRLGRKIAASTIASSSAGNAIIRSVKRISTAPIQPRK